MLSLGERTPHENQRSSVRASLGLRDAAIIWPLFQQGSDVKDLRPQARLSRQTVSASVGSRGQLFFFFFFVFFVSDLTSTRKCVLCSFHRRLKHQHCVCSYVTEWQLLWRKWSCASGHLCLWQEKKSLHKVLILISTFLFFTFIGRSCQSLLSILSFKTLKHQIWSVCTYILLRVWKHPKALIRLPISLLQQRGKVSSTHQYKGKKKNLNKLK